MCCEWNDRKYRFNATDIMRASGVVLVLTLLLCLSSTAYAAAENLLANPSFETGDRAPEQWEFRSWNQTSRNAGWSVESSGRTGQCVTIRSTNPNGADAAWTARVTVQPNTSYRLSGWIKTQNVQGATGALLNIQNLQQVKTRAINGTCDWTEVSTVFRTGESPVKLEINCLFGGWGQSTGQAWYDDISLSPLPLSEVSKAVVTMDSDAKTTPYSPMIFGGFIEHFHDQIYGGIFDPGSELSDQQGFRKDVIAAMKELKLSVVRWPGGCFASGYHWKDGVGPSRKPTPDPVWGTIDSNQFGTDEFVAWCRLVGSEPYFCTNAGNGTPEEMAEWVRYCNAAAGPMAQFRKTGGHDAPLDVRYWSVGNENWGGHEIGASTPDKWGPLVRRSAELMVQADKDLILLAAATADRNWTAPLLKAAGEYLDYVCIHGYWLATWETNATPDYLTCIMESQKPEQTITDVIDILEETGHRGRIKIAFDEWNLRGWHHPGFPRKVFGNPDDPEVKRLIAARDKNAIASQYTMADALFSASFLNACLRHADDVGMANIAPIVNTRGPLYVHPKGIVRRTTFHVLSMYANLLDKQVMDSAVTSGMLTHGERYVPLVDAIVTCDEAKQTFSVAMVNRHPSKPADCTIELKGRSLDGQFDAVVLSGSSPDDYNDIQHPDRVVPESKKMMFRQNTVSLPPHSLTIVKIR
ncbi:MAG TPA: alpha-L-arabinofuranosidase C-terminal domain-containing protein [Anaerohalosphaeraceae bacterium]|nr:alpha-L-arabinofuranosidase C-terminal domain-containing protein [Anaerohalosphaeraceae bacterium]